MAVEVRKVSLMNEKGEVVNCMLRSSFLNDLGGLGYEQDISYLNYGDGFYAPLKSSHKQGMISGRLSFIDRATAYADYRKLMTWISYSETLREDRSIQFCYAPYDGERFLRNVILTNVSKGELDVGGFLSCNVDFIALTPWYTRNTLEITSRTISGVAGENIPIYLDADMGGKYQLGLTGSIADPVVTLLDSSSNQKGIIDLTGLTITTGQTLLISTIPGNIGIWKYDAYGVPTDVIDSLVFHDGYEVFFDLPTRESVTMTIRTASSGNTFTGTMDIYSYWRTR